MSIVNKPFCFCESHHILVADLVFGHASEFRFVIEQAQKPMRARSCIQNLLDQTFCVYIFSTDGP